MIGFNRWAIETNHTFEEATYQRFASESLIGGFKNRGLRISSEQFAFTPAELLKHTSNHCIREAFREKN